MVWSSCRIAKLKPASVGQNYWKLLKSWSNGQKISCQYERMSKLYWRTCKRYTRCLPIFCLLALSGQTTGQLSEDCFNGRSNQIIPVNLLSMNVTWTRVSLLSAVVSRQRPPTINWPKIALTPSQNKKFWSSSTPFFANTSAKRWKSYTSKVLESCWLKSHTNLKAVWF